MIVVFVLGVVMQAWAMMCAGHEEKKHPLVAQSQDAKGNEQAASVSGQQTPEKAVNAGNRICPVSGEKVGQGMEPATYEYKGKAYNFCCTSCIEEFKKDPEKYIKKVEEELRARSQKETEAKHEMGMIQGTSSSEGSGMHEGHHH